MTSDTPLCHRGQPYASLRRTSPAGAPTKITPRRSAAVRAVEARMLIVDRSRR